MSEDKDLEARVDSLEKKVESNTERIESVEGEVNFVRRFRHAVRSAIGQLVKLLGGHEDDHNK